MNGRSNVQSIHAAKLSSTGRTLCVIEELAIRVLLVIQFYGFALIGAANIHLNNVWDHRGVTTLSDIPKYGTMVKEKPIRSPMVILAND